MLPIAYIQRIFHDVLGCRLGRDGQVAEGLIASVHLDSLLGDSVRIPVAVREGGRRIDQMAGDVGIGATRAQCRWSCLQAHSVRALKQVFVLTSSVESVAESKSCAPPPLFLNIVFSLPKTVFPPP